MSRLPRVIAISGSLRAKSSHASQLEALAQAGLTIEIYRGLGGLPFFNPDLDFEGAVPPPEVAALRTLLAQSQGLIVSSPEYAHGVPGALKNALDWLVSSGELGNKPALLLQVTPGRGKMALDSLKATLEVMEAKVILAASTSEGLAALAEELQKPSKGD